MKPRIEMLGGSEISAGAAKAANMLGHALGQMQSDPERIARFQVATAAAFETFGRTAGRETGEGTWRFEPVMMFALIDVLTQFTAEQLGGESGAGLSAADYAQGWALLLACRENILPPNFITTILNGMAAATADEESREPRH